MKKQSPNKAALKAAWRHGEDAVRQKPTYAPQNPYPEETCPELHEAWEQGADSAGISDIYSNGVLKKEERS